MHDQAPLEGCIAFTREHVFTAAIHIMFMRIYRFGNLYAIQRTGVPIGAPFSQVLLEVVLGRAEMYCGYDG